MISMIAAIDKNGTIGIDDKLPWNLPADLAYFKRITMGHTIVMGRKTFESIGRPLPGRKNVIVTRDKDYRAEDCDICHGVEDILKYGEGEETFIIGGANMYSEMLPFAQKLYITLIDENFNGNVFFPKIDYSQWELLSKEQGEKNEKNPHDYYFLVYEKKGL